MQTHHRLFHLPHHNINKLSVLYIVSTIRTFIITIITVFVPILLLNELTKIGFGKKEALLMTGLVLFVLYFVMLVSVDLVGYINSKLGLKSGFIISHILFIFFLAFSTFSNSLVAMVINYVVFGMSVCFWWATYHIYFINVGQRKHFGQEVSIMEMLSIVAGISGPLVGGMVITLFSNLYLYLLSIILIFISILLLLKSKDNERIENVTTAAIISEIPRHKRDFITFIGAGGVETVYTFIWPIYLYLLIKNYLNIGLIFTGIALITFICLYFIQKIIDKTSKGKMEKFGSGIVSLTWFGKAVLQNSPLILILDAVFRIFFNTFFIVPLVSIAYSHAAREHKVRYILFREVGYRLGDLLAISFFIAVVWFDLPLWSIFIPAAIFSLLPFVEKD